jgi:hypothetical protein
MKPAQEIGKPERTFDLPVHRSTGRKQQKTAKARSSKSITLATPKARDKGRSEQLIQQAVESACRRPAAETVVFTAADSTEE